MNIIIDCEKDASTLSEEFPCKKRYPVYIIMMSIHFIDLS